MTNISFPFKRVRFGDEEEKQEKIIKSFLEVLNSTIIELTIDHQYTYELCGHNNN